jgi:hypothetical protein
MKKALPILLLLALAAERSLDAQGAGRAAGAAVVATARAAAPNDLTGYWVAVITEDWRWRMITPPKGDYASIPLSIEGKRVADTWDPAKDEAAGEQCRAYGAPGLMRAPTRLHITWQDDNTLKVDSDYGMQTRLFRFGRMPAASGPATWQGLTHAEWVRAAGARGAGRGAAPKYGSMKSVTTHLRPGYLRKNGVPYSANATFTEYWDVYTERNGDQWMLVTNVVDDPTYLQMPWITSLHFKKEMDTGKWDPTPCSATF